MTDLHPQAQQLLAYVDGQLNETECAEIEALLADDTSAAEFIAQLEHSKLPYQKAFYRLLNISPEQKILTDKILTKNSNVTSRWIWPAAMAATLLLGLLLGRFFLTPHTEDHQNWRVQVADYQLLYVRDTVKHTQLNQKEIVQLEERLETALDTHLVIPDLTADQLLFKRGQILEVNGGPLIQLAYLPEQNGQPVALCITRNNAKDSGIKTDKARGLPMAYWSKNGLSYVIIGAIDITQLKQAAENAADQFSG